MTDQFEETDFTLGDDGLPPIEFSDGSTDIGRGRGPAAPVAANTDVGDGLPAIQFSDGSSDSTGLNTPEPQRRGAQNAVAIEKALESGTPKDAEQRAKAYGASFQHGVPVETGDISKFIQNMRSIPAEPHETWRKANPGLTRWIDDDPNRAVFLGDERIGIFSRGMRAITRKGEIEDALQPLQDTLQQFEDFGANEVFIDEIKGAIEKREAELTAARPALGETDRFDEFGNRIRVTSQQKSMKRGLDAHIDTWNTGQLNTERGITGTYLRSADTELRAAVTSGDPERMRIASDRVRDLEEEIASLDNEIGVQKDYEQDWLGESLLLGTKVTSSQIESFKAHGAGALVFGAAGAGLGFATRKPGAARSLGAAGARFGAKVFGLGSSYRIESGNLYLALRGSLDSFGDPMDPEVIMGASMIGGMASASIEIVSFGRSARHMGPFINAIVNGTGKNAVVAAMAQGGFSRIAKSLGKAWLSRVAIETTEEVSQEAVSFVTEYFAKKHSAGDDDFSDFQTSEFATTLTTVAKESAIGIGLTGGLGSVVTALDARRSLADGTKAIDAIKEFANAAAKADVPSGPAVKQVAQVVLETIVAPVKVVAQSTKFQNAISQEKKIAHIRELAKSTAAAEASKEFADLVEIETGAGGTSVKSFFFDPVALSEKLKGEGIDAKAYTEKVFGEGGFKKFMFALGTWVDAPGLNATLEVPLNEWFQNIAGDPLFDQMYNDVATVPGGLTVADASRGSVSFDILKLTDEIEKSVDDGSDSFSGVESQEFSERIKKLLLLSGASESDVSRDVAVQVASITTLAKRSGESVEDTFKHWNESLERQVPKLITIEEGSDLEATARQFNDETSNVSEIVGATSRAFLAAFDKTGKNADPDSQLAKDHAEVLKSIRVKKRIGKNQKERFAKLFESYLIEGKAPSPELAEAFHGYRLNLIEAYGEKRKLGVRLSDELRGIFDRMLATDEQIKAKHVRSARLWSSAEEAGVSEAQWDSYVKKSDAHRVRAENKIHSEMARAQARAREAFGSKRYKRLEEAARAEWRSNPDVQAYRAIKFGEVVLPDGTIEIDELFKGIHKKALTLRVGENDPLVADLAPVFGAAAMHPDALAETLGYENGQVMLQAIAALPSEESAIREIAGEALLESDPEVAGVAADASALIDTELGSTEGTDWILRELNIVQRKLGKRSTANVEAMRKAAKNSVAGTSVGNLDSAAIYRSEAKVGQLVPEAVSDGDFELAEALLEKQIGLRFLAHETTVAEESVISIETMVLNVAMERAAIEARTESASTSRLYVPPTLDDQPGAFLEAPFISLVELLAEATGLKEKEALGKRTGVSSAAESMLHVGDKVRFEPSVIEGMLIEQKNLLDMNVFQMRILEDALSNVSNSLAIAGRINVVGGLTDFSIVRGDLLGSIKVKPLAPGKDSLAKNTVDRTKTPAGAVDGTVQRIANVIAGLGVDTAKSVRDSFDSELTRTTKTLEFLAGDDVESPWFRYFTKPMFDAGAVKADLVEKYVKPLFDALESMPIEVRHEMSKAINGKELFKAHSDDFMPSKVAHIVMLALNLGSQSNEQRVLEGRNILRSEAYAALELLSPEMLEYVNTVWRASKAMWPMVRDAEAASTGVVPGKVESKPFIVKSSTGESVVMSGGYFPAIYSSEANGAGLRPPITGVGSFLPNMQRAGTGDSHVLARAEDFSSVIELTPRGIRSGVMSAIHDVAYREPIKAIATILTDKDIKVALTKHLGVEVTESLSEWVQDIAQLAASREQAGTSTKILLATKSAYVTAVLGAAIDNFVIDPIVLAAAPMNSKLTYTAMGHSIAAFQRNPQAFLDQARAESGYLRQRSGDTMFEIQKSTASIGQSMAGPLRFKRWAGDNAFWVASQIDDRVAAIIWSAAKNQAIDGGMSPDVANDFANDVTSKSLPAHSIMEKPSILRGKGWMSIPTVFYGFFSMTFQQVRTIGHKINQADGAKNRAKALGTGSLVYLVNTLTYRIASSLLLGKGPREDEELAEWLAMEALLGALDPLPLGVSYWAERTIRGKGFNARPGGNPLIEVGVQLTTVMGRAFDMAASDDSIDDPVAFAQSVARTAAVLLSMPGVRPARTMRYIIDLINGDAEARGVFDVIGGVTYGEWDGQPANIPVLIQDLLSGGPRR